jgi:hypothetical protein
VVGGRWKPLHYLYKRTLYTDVAVACGAGGACYVKNDGIAPFNGSVTVRIFSLSLSLSLSHFLCVQQQCYPF